MSMIRRRATAWVGIGLVCGLGLGAGAAPGGSPAATNEYVLPGMTIIGSRDAADRLPGSGQFLGVENLRLQSFGDINRVMRQVPGVYLREEEGFGLFPNISIRGVDPGRSSKATLMEDGVLTAPAPYSAPAAYYSPNVVRMKNLEILKGSSQVRYGPHITGGAINYLSTPIPETRGGYLRALVGTDSEWRAHLHYGDTLKLADGGRFGYLVEGFHRETDGFKKLDPAPGHKDSGTGFRLTEPMLKLMWEPGTAAYQRFEARVGYTDLEADETHLGLTEADFARNPYRRYAASRFDTFSSEQFRSYLRHYAALSDALELETTLYFNKFDRNWYRLSDVQNAGQTPDFSAPVETKSMASALAGGGAPLGVLKGEEQGILNVRANNREFELWGIEHSVHRRFSLGDVDHRVSLGLRYHYDRAKRFQWDDRYAQDATDAIMDRRNGIPGSQDNRIEETDALAVSLQDVANVGRFSLTGGARYEYLMQKLSDRRAGREKELDGSMNLLGGGVGFTFALDEERDLFGGVHRGFSPPQPQAALDTGVEEESSVAYELGARIRPADLPVRGELTGFYTAFDDLIVRESVGIGATGDENVGRARTCGVELALRADFGAAFGWTFGVPSFVAYTFTQAELTSDTPSLSADSIFSGARKGNRIPYIPDHAVTVGSGLRFDRWGVQAQCAYVDRTFTTASNTRDQVNADGRPDARFGVTDPMFIVDLSADVQVSRVVKIFVGAQNLFDREYVVARHPHGPRPGPPLFVYAGVEANF